MINTLQEQKVFKDDVNFQKEVFCHILFRANLVSNWSPHASKILETFGHAVILALRAYGSRRLNPIGDSQIFIATILRSSLFLP